MNDRKYTEAFYCLMNTAPVVNIEHIKKLLEEINSPECFFKLNENQINKLSLPEKIKDKLVLKKEKTNPEKLFEKLENLNAKITVYIDEDFPKILKRIKNPPVILYSKGNFNLLKQEPAFAIVGTRKSSPYGENLVEKTVKDLSINKYPIITGTATGIDTHVIKTSLINNYPCISVLSSGIDRISPHKSITLLQELEENAGCYLTEFPPGVGSFRSNYPIRANLIAALATASIIIEAPENSGALLVVKSSFNYGRNAFCFPSYIHDNNFKGSHSAIENNTAILVNDVEDIKKYQGI